MSIDWVRQNAQQQFADGVEVQIIALRLKLHRVSLELVEPVLSIDIGAGEILTHGSNDLLTSQRHGVAA